MLKKTLLACGFLMVVTGVYADVSAIHDRQELLKGIGNAMKPIGAMLKGDAPFDAAVVKTSLATVSANAKKLPALFPDDSKTGDKTEALPIIWEEKDKFNAIYGKLDQDAMAASAAITDEASLKAQMPKVLGDCKSCHDTYRQKK